jgi:hypothetical protein
LRSSNGNRNKITNLKNIQSWVPVAHSGKLKLLGKLRLGGSWSKANLGKKFVTPHLYQQLEQWYTPVIPDMVGSVKQDYSSGQPGQKVRLYLQNN